MEVQVPRRSVIDLSPLQRSRDFRLLYLGQFVSFFGSMMSYVAMPYVLYQSTQSTLLTGLLGVIQLVPSIVGGLFGGALADAVDRRRLIVVCELGMRAIVLTLGLWIAHLNGGLFQTIAAEKAVYPSAGWILIAAVSLSIFNGFHRPALEALTPMLVESKDLQAVGVLSSIRGNVGAIGGPAFAGILIASGGAAWAFLFDFLTFAICVVAVLLIKRVPKVAHQSEFSFASVQEGFRYAMSRPELVGTYVVDIIAMTFSMPSLLFPAVAKSFGGPAYLGWLHSGISIGALVATLGSRWMMGWSRHGLVILWAAGLWSVFMIGFGLSSNFYFAMIFLVLAGFADMVSAVFRQTLWNQTIPTELRGRLAGIEMISYMSGPMLGNTQLGFFSQFIGVQRAITYSSAIGVCGVLGVARWLKGFRTYDAKIRNG